MRDESRPATIDDVAELTRLAAVGRDLIRDARGGALWLDRQAPKEPLDEVFASAIEADDASVQIGCIDDVPLGFIHATVDGSEPRIAVVEEMFVLPDARGVGLGEHMMNATVSWAEDAGCVGVDGYALPGDRATKNFFETFGLVARGIVVHRSIVP